MTGDLSPRKIGSLQRLNRFFSLLYQVVGFGLSLFILVQEVLKGSSPLSGATASWLN
jgi:hypothetical protein